MDRDIERFIENYVKDINRQSAAIFAGAGLSMSSNMVSWKELLKDFAEDMGLNINKESDLISLAQYYKNERGGRGEINQIICENFVSHTAVSENHRILASLPIRTYWTTNYDQLIENSLIENGKIVDIKRDVKNLAITKPNRDVIIYKMHGDIDNPNDTIITKDDYESYNIKRQLFTTSLQSDLVSKTFLFIGFSFDDPNLSHILSTMRILLHDDSRDHYCILKKISKDDFKDKDGKVNEEEYNYAVIKQQLRINDLKRYHIKALLIEDYNEITNILKSIKRRILSRNIFISGAADIYDPFEKAEVEKFVYSLAKLLSNSGYKVISGFGQGIGSFVINGILDNIYSKNGRLLDNHLVLRPFPQNIKDQEQRKLLWHKYRKDMLSEAGIAIFLFGNKKDNSSDEIINSDGMIDEFQIALEEGLKIIPVGITGYAAKEIWEIVRKDMHKYYKENSSIIELMEKLNIPQYSNVEEINNLILEIVDLLQKSN